MVGPALVVTLRLQVHRYSDLTVRINEHISQIDRKINDLTTARINEHISQIDRKISDLTASINEFILQMDRKIVENNEQLTNQINK